VTTLTLAEAKKDLGKWLTAAVKGESVGIQKGSALVMLRPLEVRLLDYGYARKEYGVTKQEFDRFRAALEARTKKWRRAGKLIRIEDPTLEKLEEAVRSHAAPAKTARRASKN
jgi:hypothetical protein